MTRIKIVVLALAMSLLSAALMGCAGASGDMQDNFTGSWELCQMEGDGVSEMDTVRMMAEQGLTITLDLQSGNVAKMSVFGVENTGTWTQKDASTAVITIDGADTEMKFVDGKIEMPNGDGTMAFQKVGTFDDASSPAVSSSSASSASASSQAA